MSKKKRRSDCSLDLITIWATLEKNNCLVNMLLVLMTNDKF